MAFDFGIIGDYMSEYFDSDEMDIGRYGTITLPDGSITVTNPEIPLYENEKCHITVNETPNPDPVTAGTMPIIVSLTIICDKSIDLKNADFITARKLDTAGNVIAVYKGSIGLPVVNQGRQAATMVSKQAV